MIIKTEDLNGPALDWAVAKCEGFTPVEHTRLATVMVERKNARGVMQPEHISALCFSTNWSLGGPIIERECLAIFPGIYVKPMFWCAVQVPGGSQPFSLRDLDGEAAWYFTEDEVMVGPTPLVAAMRCLVASKLGDEVEVPEELIPNNSYCVSVA